MNPGHYQNHINLSWEHDAFACDLSRMFPGLFENTAWFSNDLVVKWIWMRFHLQTPLELNVIKINISSFSVMNIKKQGKIKSHRFLKESSCVATTIRSKASDPWPTTKELLGQPTFKMHPLQLLLCCEMSTIYNEKVEAKYHAHASTQMQHE